MAYNGPLPQVVKAGGSGASTLTGVVTGNGTSAFTANTITQHALLVGGAANAVSSLGVATDGQIPIGSTGANPTLATLTAGTGINITNGAGTITIAVAAGSSVVETLTGNSGGAISPTTGNINTLGTGSITISGSGSTLTTQLTGLTNHNLLVGAGTATITNVAPSATSGVPVISQGASADPIFGTAVVAGGGTGQVTLTSHSVLVGAATAAITQLSVGTNGQVLIGATAADPAFATLTSSDSSISFTTGANTLSLQVAAGSTVLKTITGNSGGAESPSAGNFNILGTGSITVVGSANTETIQLSGLTNHALQIGGGTATLTQLGPGTTGQILQTNTTADPTWSTATYPSTTTVSQLLYSSATNTVAGLATANSASLATTSAGVPTWLGPLTNGQVVIGSTGATPVAATLSAGAGIAITNAAGSVTIAATGSGFTWSDNSGTFTAAVDRGYFITGTSTVTLPASPSEGQSVAFIVDTTQVLTITVNTAQAIRVGSVVTAASPSVGTCTSNARGDSIQLVYRTTGSVWICLSAPQGTWSII